MNTGPASRHKHSVGGRFTTIADAHSHDLAALEAAIAAGDGILAGRLDTLEARIAALEAAPVTPPPPPPPPEPWPWATLQAAIDATPPGGLLDATGREFSAGVTISEPLTLRGGTLRVPSGNGIEIASANVTLDGVTIFGNGDTEAMGIWALRAPGLVIRNCHVADWRYAGIMILETTGALVEDTRVAQIGVGVGGATNAYGIAVSNLGGEQSRDVLVRRCTIDGVPNWHGLDSHGSIGVRFIANTVAHCNRAIFVTSDSVRRPSESVEVSRNRCDTPTPRADVLNTRPWNEVGITVVTGSLGVHGDGNVLDGWPAGNAIDVQGSGATFAGTIVTNPS